MDTKTSLLPTVPPRGAAEIPPRPPLPPRAAPAPRRVGARRPRPLRIGLVSALLLALVAGTAWGVTVLIEGVGYGAAETGAVTRGDQDGSASARSGGTPTAEDGYIADGETLALSDESAPAVGRLDPALRAALQQAQEEAGAQGIDLRVASGWRSRAYQRWLLREAVGRYGSEEEASRWVGTPKTSQHVKGQAVDIGPYAAADWLNRKGAQFGLCRVYDNEAWHFELSPSATDEGCPPLFTDPTQDPRMQQ